jgi:hypothetical protein
MASGRQRQLHIYSKSRKIKKGDTHFWPETRALEIGISGVSFETVGTAL